MHIRDVFAFACAIKILCSSNCIYFFVEMRVLEM